jgi:hypothetical protein
MKQQAYIVLVVIALLCAIGWTGHSQQKRESRTTWEFTTVYTEQEANNLGAQGWDLVTVRSDLDVREGTGNSRPTFHLKRTR